MKIEILVALITSITSLITSFGAVILNHRLSKDVKKIKQALSEVTVKKNMDTETEVEHIKDENVEKKTNVEDNRGGSVKIKH